MFATSFYWNFCLVHYVYFQRFFFSKDLNENYLALMSDKNLEKHSLFFFGYSERLLAPLEKDSKLPKYGSDPIVRAKKLTRYIPVNPSQDCKKIWLQIHSLLLHMHSHGPIFTHMISCKPEAQWAEMFIKMSIPFNA